MPLFYLIKGLYGASAFSTTQHCIRPLAWLWTVHDSLSSVDTSFKSSHIAAHVELYEEKPNLTSSTSPVQACLFMWIWWKFRREPVICRPNVICRAALSHAVRQGWWRESGASKLLQGSDFTCCCFPSVWQHVMALYTHITAWKQMLSPLKRLLNLVTFHWLQDQHHEDVLMLQIYWLHYAELFTMISAQSSQWPAGFYHVGESFILSWIYIWPYHLIQGGWWSQAGETSHQGTLQKIH